MNARTLFALVLSIPFSHAAETILGLYIFSRHGDRTAKATPPSVLTDLGYREVFDSGSWFRENYVALGAPKQIAGIETDIVKLSQLAVSAPLDTVLMPSAQGFMQGMYPPVGPTLGSIQLRNKTTVEAPLNGYQIIPIQQVTSGTASENQAWLQGSSNCNNAVISSNEYFTSPEYLALLDSTKAFYQDNILPSVNATFNSTQTTFFNAYSLFDLLNVAEIHNATINSSSLLTNDILFQLRTLADIHEFNLAYNASAPVRAITGATIASQVLQALNSTVATPTQSPKLNVQFGAYGGFQSFFGLANLTSITNLSGTDNFYGIPDYASTMTFELFTTVAPSPFPAPADLQVRFLFHNGTTGNSSVPNPYPLFGRSTPEMSWTDFVAGMNKFAVGDQASWCAACGNTTGVCANAASGSGDPSAAPAAAGSKGGISTAVGGVIGAMVTLGVILGVEALIMLLAGLRLVRKDKLSGGAINGPGNGVGVKK